MKRIKQFFIDLWVEKQLQINPDEPDTIGGMGVIHEYETITPWLRRASRASRAFVASHWQFLITIGVALVCG